MPKFSLKPQVYFSQGATGYLTTIKKSNALVITDPFMVESGLAEKVLKLLRANQTEYSVFSDIKPDPPVELIAEGIKKMHELKPDLIIALGGGSTIDAAKSILVLAANLLRKIDLQYQKPLFIAIPTTSGTGSEVTSFSVISCDNKKIPLVDDALLPDVAIIDTDFVMTVPPQITADTAIDALTHSIEAYVSTEASDYTDALAEKSVKLIFDYLIRAYQDGSDLEAREKLHNASCLAGMAFTNASLGVNHSLAHALGGYFHIPHGRANAMLLPHVIRYNAGAGSEPGLKTKTAARYAELAKLIGLPASTNSEGVNNLICAVQILLQETGTPLCLKSMNLDKNKFMSEAAAMAETALQDKCTATNPRKPGKEELIKIYTDLYGII